MRKGLIVGIDYYEHVGPLHGCVNDAHAVKAAIDRHSDGSVNFTTKLLAGTGPSASVTRSELRSSIQELFEGDGEISLLYFAGHGHIEMTGGYLATSEIRSGDEGVPLSEILSFANASEARNRVIVLDSCHSGIAGDRPTYERMAELKEGTTILTASTATQYASEENGSGVFTTLFVDALNGAAANLVGEITPGSIYAHIDQSLGAWDQRPVFKTNVKSFVSLRQTQAPVDLADLRRLTEFFPTSGVEFDLDPSFEPRDEGRSEGMPAADSTNNAIFAILQSFNRVGLVVPVDTPHMWNAAMESKSCRLTVLGEHYRRLVASDRI